MNIKIDDNFLLIAKAILSFNKNNDEWSAIESDDMFQTERYEGGYDATEEAFCFSYYDTEGKEYWFQLSLDEIKQIEEKKKLEIKLTAPE